MIEAKHTPGPWAVTDCAIGGPSVTAGKSVIADIRTFGGVHVNGEQNTKTLANARLIAAAPDLLDALDSCIGTLEICFPEAPVDSVIGKDIATARAAIAKATTTTTTP